MEQKIVEWVNQSFSQLFNMETMISIMRFGILILIVLPLLLLFTRWINKYLTKKLTPQQGMIFGKLIWYTGIFVVAFSVLSELGFKLTHLLGAAGIVGIAVGFASQTSVSNIISGFFLIAEKPFEVGDVITVQGITGMVLSIDTLSIKIRTFDNKFVRIPNETIIKNELTNITRFPIRRVDLNVGVAYKEDIGRVREILLNVAKLNPLCLMEPEPLVIFNGFGDSSLDFMFVVWAEKPDWLLLRNSIAEDVKKRFDAEAIEIPFPHLSLYTGSSTEPLPIQIVKTQSKRSDQATADSQTDDHSPFGSEKSSSA